MASTITAGNATNGLALSCDNTGILELKTGTGAGTTGLTIDASQNVTLATGIAGDFKMNSGYGSVATAYGCRAWVNFNGTGTVAIRASANVTSITDNGTGDYTVNFTTSMPDANYSAVFGFTNGVSNNGANLKIQTSLSSSVNVIKFENNAAADAAIVCVSIFR
jgi:hypothetical protein